jgi:calcineurin-like phosphoesterase family protein
MAKFAFADPHFDSERMIAEVKRPFDSVSIMNTTIIRNYNMTVNKQDIVYWLGDVMYGATKDKVRHILNILRGRKFLILGNHDRGHSVNWWLSCGFERVYEHPVYDAENFIMLSHEPLEEFGNRPPIMNYHGHIHTQDYDFPDHKQCKNVCLEVTDYKPILIENPWISVPRKYSSR